jgi:hypothetical protein
VTRFGAFSAQAEGGNVVVLRGPRNEDWFTALESFPPPKNTGHDDDADSTSEAFNELTGKRPMVIATKFCAALATRARARGADVETFRYPRACPRNAA